MKNKLLNSLLNIITSACVIFTGVVFAFYILGDIMSSTTQVLTLKNLFLLFLFSVWFTVSNNLFLKSKKMNVVLRTIFHFISTTVGFFVIFVYLPGNIENPSSAFVLTLGFICFYAIIAGIIFGVKGAINKNKKDKEQYNSVYNKEDKE